MLGLCALLAGCGSVSSASSDTGAQPPPVSVGAPVVEVLFDELPTATLMNSSGTGIDGRRFPGFAKLAAHSTWYQNNTTVADFTGRAVPAIETGNNPSKDTLPTFAQQPHSIFTLLGGKYRFNVDEPVTNVCPPSLCHKGSKRRQPPGPGRAGATSANKPQTGGHYAQDLLKAPKPGEFQHFLARIPREVPHEPFHFLPDGRSYNYTPISDVGSANAERWAGGVGGTATTWQRHYIQTAYADRLTSLLIRRLKQVGIWRKALVIVTADHGISFDPKTFRRIAEPAAFGGIANPPLFIKYPGQTNRQVSDIHSQTIDIVPTTAQVLGIDLPYKTEGVPISEDGTAGPVTILNGFNQEVSAPLSTVLTERNQVLGRAAKDLGANTGLFALGPSLDPLHFCCGTAGLEELRILLLAVCGKPVDVKKLREGTFDGGVVESQGNEAAFLIERVAEEVCVSFQFRPVGAERVRRHAEHEHAGVLQPFLNLRRDTVAGLQFPLVEPHTQLVGPQALRDGAHDRLVLRAVAQEYVVLEIVGHASPPALLIQTETVVQLKTVVQVETVECPPVQAHHPMRAGLKRVGAGALDGARGVADARAF